MKLGFDDELVIDYGGMILKARLANGFDSICNNPECIKVIFEGDSSYNPKTVKKEDVISINGKKPNWEGER